MITIKEVSDRIQANPLGRLMYGQRELFHSNLIGWFFDTLPGPADAVFRPFAAPGSDRDRYVEREASNLDLVFHWQDRAPVVVENKVFSLPMRDQLERYAAVTARWPDPPALVVLSISAPTFPLPPWRYLSYAGLAARILDALPADSSYEVETMRRYATLVRDLVELVSATDVRSGSEEVWLPRALLSSGENSQLQGALNKARASRVARVLNDALPMLGEPVKSDMSNATPLVEAFERVSVQGTNLRVGWQLQGNQFRRAIILDEEPMTGRSAKSKGLREEFARAHTDLFDFPSPLPQVFGGSKEFNHFAPDFVYRYVKTPSLTVAELTDAAAAIGAMTAELRTADRE